MAVFTLAAIGLAAAVGGIYAEQEGVINVIPDDDTDIKATAEAANELASSSNESAATEGNNEKPSESAPEPLPESTGGSDVPPRIPVTPPPAERERNRSGGNNKPELSKRYDRNVTRRSKSSSDNEILRYPYEALTEDTDYLQIDIVDYVSLGRRITQRNKLDNKKSPIGSFKGLSRDFSDPTDRGRQITSNPRNVSNSTTQLSKRSIVRKGTIILPMPENISDTNSVSYADSSMNALTAIGLGEGIDFMRGTADDITSGKSPKEILDNVGNRFVNAGGNLAQSVGGVDGIQDLITKKLATALVGQFGANVTIDQLLARQDGVIFNPNKELLFNGVNLRNFNFQFKLMPRSKDESDQIKYIIRSLKRNMAPVVSEGSGSGFLNTPSVFELRYRTGHKNHEFLHKFKQCFLENMTVNYTGDGFYTTYDDGVPVSIILNLSFKEIEPVYDIDYDDKSSGVGVGY
tara:strand:- start:527 stop:1912 length:1386 start_codon:yes stop_codon:yes gene_type:complete